MIRRAIAFFVLLWASPGLAVPVEVTSGEHDGFTRIVLNFGAQTDWEFGRTIDGYRFRPIGKTAEYDLKPVFDKIGKTRLAAISANPDTQELDIGFACACHAFPFEFRPGIIVIDLRDGPPPKGSSFENPLRELAEPVEQAPENPPAPPAPSTVSGAEPGYNWLNRFVNPASVPPLEPTASLAPMPSSKPDLQPLRDQLLRQLSRGAAEGVIELAMPDDGGPIPPKAEVDAARVALDELGGIETRTARAPAEVIGAEGAKCVENAALAVTDWGGEGDPSTLLARDMSDLVGEFDAPQAEAVTRAVRARLHLGFGTEARLLLNAFPNVADDSKVLTALSYLVDGEPDLTGSFGGQGRCATAAALWAGLSDPDITQASQLDEKAALFAFSGLPTHLRRTLAPRLIDRFLALKDEASAQSVREMAFRANDEVTPELALAEAKIDLAKGDPAAAESHLESAQSGVSETSAGALIARVKARVAQGLAVDAATLSALEAMQTELEGTELAEDMAVALLHARAASGDFAASFAGLDDSPAEAGTIWAILSLLGDDSSVLLFAVPAPQSPIAGLARETAQRLASRLLDLGLPDPALAWAQLGNLSTGPLSAQIHLARRDGRAALQALDGREDAESLLLRAQAFRMLNDNAAAAETLRFLPEETQKAATIQALALAKDWTALAQQPTSDWAKLAENLNREFVEPTGGIDTFGPLARGLALAEQSAATRAEIENLLRSVPNPAAPAEPTN